MHSPSYPYPSMCTLVRRRHIFRRRGAYHPFHQTAIFSNGTEKFNRNIFHNFHRATDSWCFSCSRAAATKLPPIRTVCLSVCRTDGKLIVIVKKAFLYVVVVVVVVVLTKFVDKNDWFFIWWFGCATSAMRSVNQWFCSVNSLTKTRWECEKNRKISSATLSLIPSSPAIHTHKYKYTFCTCLYSARSTDDDDDGRCCCRRRHRRRRSMEKREMKIKLFIVFNWYQMDTGNTRQLCRFFHPFSVPQLLLLLCVRCACVRREWDSGARSFCMHIPFVLLYVLSPPLLFYCAAHCHLSYS